MTTKTELRTLTDAFARDTAVLGLNNYGWSKKGQERLDRFNAKLLTLLEDTVREALQTEIKSLIDNDVLVYWNDDRDEDGHIFISDLKQRLVELKEQPRASSRQAERSQGHGTQE